MESGEKILIFSEMFPKAKSSSSGIFIIERLKALQQLGVDFDFAPVSTFDSFSMSLIKRLMGIRPSTPTETVQIGDKQFPVLKVDLGLKERIGLIRQETRSWVKYAEKMAEAIEKRKKVCEFSLLHAHRVFPEGYAAMLLSQKHSIPYVVTAHGSEIHSVSDKNKTVVREILQRAATSIFVSHALMKDASEKLGYDGTNGIVIPNGVDTEVFKPIDKEDARKKLSLPLDKKIVGFVGNLIEVKGADRLPAIAKELMKLRSDVFFLIVGDGPLLKTLRDKMPMEITRFTGRIDHELMPVAMNAIDVLVFPSRKEGLPTAILEARACGVRVVGSNAGGIPEAIRDMGSIVMEPDDIERQFAKILSIDLSALSEANSPRKTIDIFSWKEAVRRESAVYSECSK